jgi:hypothetical protein
MCGRDRSALLARAGPAAKVVEVAPFHDPQLPFDDELIGLGLLDVESVEAARDQRERRRRGRPYARKASGNRGTHHSTMNTQALGESATARYTNGRKHSRIRGMNRSQLTTNRRPGCFSTASTNASHQ